MNDQERQIISDIFTRLEQTAGQARDTDAERLIADKVKTQPYAPYAMAQALYVQEEAMKSLNGQLEQLKAENEQLRQQASHSSGGFMSSIFGGGARSPAPAPFGRPAAPQAYAQPQYAPQQGGPWGGAGAQPQAGPWGGQPQMAAPGGGGFLRGALTTAAGVAGGMVVGNALMNAFSGGGHHALGGFSQSDMASMGGGLGGGDGFSQGTFDQAGFDQGGFDQGGLDQGGFSQGSDAGAQDASFDTGGGFGGGDFGGGGGDDSSWT